MDSTPNHALEELRAKRETARLGGGLKRQEAIRSSGRGTARDRIGLLLDELEALYFEVASQDDEKEGFFWVVLAREEPDRLALTHDDLLRLVVPH